MSNAQRKAAQTQAAAEVTGMRWCRHGSHNVDAEKGGFVMRGRIRAWMCHSCQVKTGRLKAA